MMKEEVYREAYKLKNEQKKKNFNRIFGGE